MLLILVWAYLPLAVLTAWPLADPTWWPTTKKTIATPNGRVTGLVKNGVWGFLGVPFAKPPIGPLRFAPPEALETWDGVRDATKPASSCFQGSGSEDCLYLNAFMPASKASLAPAKFKPVVVIIHGGGFIGGRAAQNWDTVQQTDVVVFNIQYRLGVFGFFSLQSPSKNLGMQDQQMALHWVQKNAAAFGGDASQVMIHGCSAGGASVAGHLVLQGSFGLYKAASLESPGGHQGWMGDKRRTNDDWMSTALSDKNSQQLAKHFNCSRPSTSGSVECLRNVTTPIVGKASLTWRFAPSMPEEGQYPLGLIQRGHWNQVPTMVGGASCESCMDAAGYLGSPSKSVDKERFDQALIRYGLSGVNGSGIGPSTLEKWYARRIASEGRWRTFARILGDSGHSCNTALHAEALAVNSSKVWRYLFDVRHAGLPGATHCSEAAWLEHTHKPSSDAETLLENTIANWWANFATHGDPNLGSHSNATWSRFSLQNPKTLMLSADGAIMTSTADTVRSECSNWKPFLGWGKDKEESTPKKEEVIV